MKQSTVDALDKADRLNAQMDWLLFTNEQDRRLFGYSPILWEPGEPLGRYVTYADSAGETHYMSFNNDTSRPMFEVLHDWRFVAEALNYYNRCRPCQTWWATAESCWVCGEEREPMSASWKKLRYMCYAMGLERTEEQVDEMLLLATERAEEARQQRREAVRKMTEGMRRSLELATTRMQAFNSVARTMFDHETFGFPWDMAVTHELDNDGAVPGYRRWQLVTPRRHGRSLVRSWVDEASRFDTTNWASYWDFPPAPNLDIFKKKPFTWPDISRRYDPWLKDEMHNARPWREFRVINVTLTRARRAVKLYAPIIKEPVINLGNPILEEYLRREELRDTNPVAYEMALQRRRRA